MIQKILAGIIPTIEVVITALFIDSAISIFNGTSEIKSIASPILLIMILTAYEWFSEQLSRIAQVKLEAKLREKFRCEMVEKTASIKYIYIEDQDTLDLISRVIGEIETKCNDAYASMLDMFAMVVKILGLLCLLFAKVWWCSLVIVAISVPLFLLALKGGQVTYEAGRKVQKYYRRVGYLEDVLNGRDSVDERSVFNYSKSVNKMWVDFYELSRKIVFKANLEWYLKSKIGSVITAALSMIIVVILIFPLKAGLLTIGMFMSISNSVFSLINLLSWSLPGYGDALSKNAEYMIDLDNFMNLEKEEGALEEPSEEKVVLKSLEFKNVSFKYPGDSNYVLRNLSFKIVKGKHYALVGTNGAGKTTIIKLIIGLYKDYEGEILINGRSLKEYTQNEIKSLTSIVYQDFAKYNLSFKDNIALGDVRNIDDIDQVKDAIRYMELDDVIDKLENGLDSNLGKIKEDGIDLSGGQWQRIAIARSFISKSSLKILDEPTAALDPISENEIYNKFEKLSRGNTVIFISHRLASTKLADEIFVLDKGQIVEKGSFDELIDVKGIYSDMYETSAFKSYYIYTLVYLLISTLSGLFIGLNTVVMQKFFDIVLSYINLNSTMKEVIISLVILGAVVIGQQIIQGVINFMSTDLPLRIRGNVCEKLNLKSGRLNAIDFENPEFLDDINKAKVGLEYSIQLVLVFFLVLTSYLPYFIFMGIYLYKLKPILSVSIVLVFIPVMLSQYLRTMIYANLEDESAPIRRAFGHYESCIVSREYFKETRTLGAFKYFRKLYKESLEVLNKEIWKSEKKVFFIELSARLITLVGYISILMLLVYSLIDKSISVGAFAAVHTSIDTMFSMMDEVICTHIGSITQSVGTVKNYIRFLRLPEREGINAEVKEKPEVIMNNVSFRYPLTNEDSIKNISLLINKGETVAIVGENGAGKSTLIKLITGVYAPTEGGRKYSNK